jgi:hypothetical protein
VFPALKGLNRIALGNALVVPYNFSRKLAKVAIMDKYDGP